MSRAVVGAPVYPVEDGAQRSERLSILLFCYEYPPLGGGGGVGAKAYAEGWAEKGHEVRVITGGGPGLPSRELVGGVEIVRVRHAGSGRRATHTNLAMLIYILFGALHVWKDRRELSRFDVLNTHFALPTGPLGALASRVLGRPNVLTIIGGDIYDPSKSGSPHRHVHWRVLNRWLIRSADEVMAISTDTKRRAEEHYGIRRAIRVSNYGFRPSAEAPGLTPRRTHEGDFQLVAIGRLVERKGFRYLIEALSQLPESVGLWIIGDGPLATSLERLAVDMRVSGRVSFLGYLPPPEILAHLRAADCFVLSSLHEGLGIVVQEAMYAGLPIVSTDNGGQVDLIQAHRNGLLVPTRDPDALAHAVRALMDDPGLALSMGDQNRADVKRCDVSAKCDEYLAVFRELTLPEVRG